MEKKLLKTGDVIVLENGMKVYGLIPECFVYGNKLLSNELTGHEIIVGKNYSLPIVKNKLLDEVVKDIKGNFDNRLGLEIDDTVVRNFVVRQIRPATSKGFMLESGEFVVTDTKMEGGSGRNAHDYYPDGHHVYCQKLKDGKYDKNGVKITFYQSGCFTAKMVDIKPIRKMKKKETHTLTFD